MGKELTDRKLRNSEGYERGVNTEKALTNFAANSDFVRSRGLITTKKEHRLEAARVPNDVPLDIVPLIMHSAGVQFAKVVWEIMREAAKKKPVQALGEVA